MKYRTLIFPKYLSDISALKISVSSREFGAAGYKTAYIGKWHLGDADWYPEKQGYDENWGGCDYGQPPSYFDPYKRPKHKHPAIRAGIPGFPIGQFPTILDGAGVELPGDRPIDGLSLVEHLRSGGTQELKRDELIWHFPHYRHAPGPYSIIRKGDWKLIHF